MVMNVKKFTAGQTFWESALTLSLVLSLLAGQISISVEQSFIAFGVAIWIVLLVAGKRSLRVPAFFWPLVGFAGLSLLSSALSVNPGLSLKNCRNLLLFLIVPIGCAAFRRAVDKTMAYGAILASGFANAVYSIGYSLIKAAPGERVRGFMGHYMTQAGLLSLFGAVALGFIVFGRGKNRLAWAGSLILASYALVLTSTRSGWIGLGAGLGVVLLLWRPKALLILPVLAGIFFVISPRPVRDRALSILSLREPSNQYRLEYARAGAKIIADYPLLGTGPDTVDMVFQNPKYGLSEIAKRNVHLHSDVMQIGAERGLPALAAWLAFVVTAVIGLVRLLKKKPILRAPAVGALAALAAVFIAGLFEYNFGDSEVATLLLFVLTLPFCGEHRDQVSLPTPGAP
jgi:O-antigen ligase